MPHIPLTLTNTDHLSMTHILSPLVVMQRAKHLTEVWAGGVLAGVISSDSEKGEVGSSCEEKVEERVYVAS